MSEEEKKAWDNLIMLMYFTQEKEDKQAIGIILKLVDKQQKEIEELKKGNKSLIDSRKKWKDRYYKEKEKNKILVNPNEYIIRYYLDGKKQVIELFNFIHKNKVKELLKYLEDEGTRQFWTEEVEEMLKKLIGEK